MPLNRDAFDLLARRQSQQGEAPDLVDLFVFAGPSGARPHGITTAWRNLRAAAKLGDCRLHDLRHYFASRLVQQGTDLNVVYERLGHSDFTMVQRYAHLDPKNLAAAVERVSRSAS